MAYSHIPNLDSSTGGTTTKDSTQSNLHHTHTCCRITLLFKGNCTLANSTSDAFLPDFGFVRFSENPGSRNLRKSGLFVFFLTVRNPISENPDCRESENPDFQMSGLPNIRKSGFSEIRKSRFSDFRGIGCRIFRGIRCRVSNGSGAIKETLWLHPQWTASALWRGYAFRSCPEFRVQADNF